MDYSLDRTFAIIALLAITTVLVFLAVLSQSSPQPFLGSLVTVWAVAFEIGAVSQLYPFLHIKPLKKLNPWKSASVQ